MSRRRLRALAWVAGGAAFAAPWGVLAVHPKPAAAVAQPQTVQKVIIRKIIRHVYTQQAPTKTAPKVRYVYAPAAKAAPAPVTSSGGSRP
jgi:hypothetical protein